jgi:hypothetical protein
MLLYLSTSTRIDIAMAVGQVACFNHLPKKSHATAVKMIVCYLNQTTKEPSSPQVETCLWIAMSTPILLDFMVASQTVNLQGQSPALAT